MSEKSMNRPAASKREEFNLLGASPHPTRLMLKRGTVNCAVTLTSKDKYARAMLYVLENTNAAQIETSMHARTFAAMKVNQKEKDLVSSCHCS